MPDAADLTPYAAYFSRPVAAVAADLRAYEALLLKWNRVTNLVSRETESTVWSRHIVDSLQLLPLIPQTAQHFLDLGSGGGLPAIPLAIAFKGGPRHVTLVEPIQKKVSFLRTAIRELALPADVEAARIEDTSIDPLPDVLTSRALANLTDLLRLSLRYFKADTVALFHKGGEHAKELAESRSAFAADVVVNRSSTDKSGVILAIRHPRLVS